MTAKIRIERPEQRARHRGRDGQRDVHGREPDDEPGEQDDRQEPEDDAREAVPAAERRVDAELLGDAPDIEVLPRQEQVDEQEHALRRA